MKRFSLLLLLLLPILLSAQQITFRLVDARSAAPINDLLGGSSLQDITRFSNEKGFISFPLPRDSQGASFIFSGLGYQTLTYQVPAELPAEIITLKIQPQAVDMEAILVEAPLNRKRDIVNALDISLRPLNNAQEVLRMVPGLFIGQHAGGGKAEQVFLRGFDIDHGTDIQLTVDGMPVNMVSHAHGQGYADLHFVIPELIERVDFAKGPYLAEKGNFTTAGWVDFKTKTALEQSTVKLEVGQFDTYRAFAAIDLLSENRKAAGQSAYIAAEYNFSDSYFDAPQDFSRINVQAKLNGRFSPRTSYTATASYFTSTWDHSGQIPDRAVERGLIGFFGAIDPTEGGNTARTNFNFQTFTYTDQGNLFKNQVYFSNYEFELFSNFTFFLEDPVLGDQIRQYERRNLLGYHGSYTNDHRLGNKQASFHAGLQYRHDFSRDNELANTTNRTETRSQIQLGDINEANVSLYANEFIRFNAKWSMDVGARLEYFHNSYTDRLQNNSQSSASATTFLPKLNLFYQANSSTNLYLKTGKGFHSNDTRVVVPQQGREILPAAYGSDLGMLWKPHPRLLIHPALWYLWLDQEFVYVGDAGIVEASGKSRRIGADLSIRYQLSNRWFADVDANVTKPRAVEEAPGEQFIPLAPTFTTTGGISYHNPMGLSANLRYRYLADRPGNEDNSVVAVGYFVTDAQLMYTHQAFTIGLHINNLFNTRWKETQFNTESRLFDEAEAVEEIHFTPGSPFFARLSFSYSF